MTNRTEQPWAFAYRNGFKGNAPGLYFRYYETKDEAEEVRLIRLLADKYVGEVEYRPVEAFFVGYAI